MEQPNKRLERPGTTAPVDGTAPGAGRSASVSDTEGRMLCRLCETEQRLVKAHVVPEGFFQKVRPNKSFNSTPLRGAA